jgi:hypothetical protein
MKELSRQANQQDSEKLLELTWKINELVDKRTVEVKGWRLFGGVAISALCCTRPKREGARTICHNLPMCGRYRLSRRSTQFGGAQPNGVSSDMSD